jgi:hypothetical protein|tara:strand:+ start:176 stop:373 length:198 start_codon:yes stop_codon:yes gene_type:complete
MPLDTHNLNSAIHLILREEGISEVKHVTIKEKRDNSTISFEDQRGKKIEMNVTVENSTRCCSNCS